MRRLSATFMALWRSNRWLTATFVIALAFAIFFSLRAVAFFIYWHNHYEEPIEGWMTVRYVSHSYRLPPQVIHQAIELPPDVRDHRMLVEIARERNVPFETLRQTVLDAILQWRQDNPEAGTGLPRPPPLLGTRRQDPPPGASP
ncbi:hypothetical protein [Pseudohoeflea coraliihabitans]|uniref:Uncharacterized protein n=1 Tax=Pseudohoeflea coraliihabitans TaxID=2860393 RepID=A0ABS6WRP3_9HYPH|nr:hypothetical protein [Pseudohoeflea sp. DP4N28-3]MBW3098082.1 hypothetical protein [Pseudohoeflea sp. DP4N28-3]